MALYNAGYPATYQPMFPTYQQPYQIPVQQQNQPQAQPNQSSIIWVSGEAGAKAYLVAPNNTVQLWDSEAQVIYLKSADASGMPSMKILDYTIRDANKSIPIPPVASTENLSLTFATKDEIQAITDQITALRERVDGITRRRKREDDGE